MNYRALDLEAGESVIYQVRKHWIIFLGYGAGLILISILPIMVMSMIQAYFPSILTVSISGNIYALFLFFYSLWLLTLWVSFFVDWTKYYLDVWYVTQKRIIIIDQKQLFDRQISNIRFDRIQDVSVNIDGFIPTLLDFGNIRVQTASEDNSEFSMTVVRHPKEVRQIIFSQHNEISDKK